ncbi:MAG: amylase [Halomonas sp.]|uniref:PqqD family peptide modification chaperone n=1 Tax=Halomonas sp. TaxID=1486246 RepID=UPI0019E748D9|nr:PqqD family peptide modification chaperone [Halomonas sp.]MBE0488082.1 amylase [Halomonas sp.]
MTEQHSPTRRFWLGGRRAAEQDRFFREALEPLGWEAGDEQEWDAGWVTGMPDPAQFRRVSPARRLNHFPGNTALTIKSRLHASLSTLRERIVASHGADSDAASRLAFFPHSWVMPHDYHALQEAALANPEQRWILKPTNASKGKGVRVLRDAGEAPLAADWLVQEYLANPHTIRGHKYVLRLYVLISSLEPLRVYLYRQGFAKLASEPWDPEDADNPYSQLTNPDINALNDRAEVPVEFIDLERYRTWLRDQGHDDDRLFARIHDLVALTAISGVDAMRSRTAEVGADPRGCYELLGLDCLVDDTLKPWILECNLSPSLGICAAPESGGRIEEAVKGGLVRDMVALLDIPGIDATQPEEDMTAARLVTEAEAEQARAGDFLRLLPAEEPARYLPFFSLPTLADLQLAEGLAGQSLPQPVLQRRRVAELLDDDQLALHDTRSGHYYRPNDTAAMIWLLATEGLDPDAIVDQLALAAAQTEGSPDLAALRRDVWSTLGEWCRDGLLCQRGPALDDAPATEAVPTARARPHLLQLDHDGQRWALEVGTPAALARLTPLFGERLTPLDELAAVGLPRLALLPGATGYALVADHGVARTRLTLAELVPALLAHLVGEAARPGRPVIDAGLLVTPEGVGVLCLLPDEAARQARLQWLTATGGGLTRGVRLSLSAPDEAEPLSLPLAMPAGEAPASTPDRVAIRAVLVPAEAEEAMAPAGVLDVMGALLSRCITAPDVPLTPGEVTALSEWVSRLERLAVGDVDHSPTADPLIDWLTGRDATVSRSVDPAMAGKRRASRR